MRPAAELCGGMAMYNSHETIKGELWFLSDSLFVFFLKTYSFCKSYIINVSTKIGIN